MSIQSWAEEDRPREKLVLKGKHTLSITELLAILIGSGSKNQSALDLANIILSSVKHDLNQLSKLQFNQLISFKGIGEAKAVVILAALEIARRKNVQIIPQRVKITTSQDAYEEMKDVFIDLDHEQFWILLLDRANKVIQRKMISAGGVAGTVVDAKIIFKYALMTLASGIILFHNHPSGNLRPSKQDRDITKKLMEAAKSMDILILDHIIIGERTYLSFKDEGLL